MSSIDPEFWFSAIEQDQRNILLELRSMIKNIDPSVIEEIKWGRPCYSNSRGMFCYLASAKSYATLGFQKGVLLDASEGLLEGTGKGMRHVKFYSSPGPIHPVIESFIRQAGSL